MISRNDYILNETFYVLKNCYHFETYKSNSINLVNDPLFFFVCMLDMLKSLRVCFLRCFRKFNFYCLPVLNLCLASLKVSNRALFIKYRDLNMSIYMLLP